MKTTDIANKLVKLCKQGKDHEALALYAADAISVEASMPPGMDRVSRGVAAIKGKSQWWLDNNVVHSVVVAGPWPHGDRFIVGFKMDVTFKATGVRSTMEEMGLYTVKNGKIVSEEFFYSGG